LQALTNKHHITWCIHLPAVWVVCEGVLMLVCSSHPELLMSLPVAAMQLLLLIISLPDTLVQRSSGVNAKLLKRRQHIEELNRVQALLQKLQVWHS
jgi:uncharacterized protein (DUF2384 family)